MLGWIILIIGAIWFLIFLWSNSSIFRIVIYSLIGIAIFALIKEWNDEKEAITESAKVLHINYAGVTRKKVTRSITADVFEREEVKEGDVIITLKHTNGKIKEYKFNVESFSEDIKPNDTVYIRYSPRNGKLYSIAPIDQSEFEEY